MEWKLDQRGDGDGMRSGKRRKKLEAKEQAHRSGREGEFEQRPLAGPRTLIGLAGPLSRDVVRRSATGVELRQMRLLSIAMLAEGLGVGGE